MMKFKLPNIIRNIFKSRKKLLEEYQEVNDGEKRIGSGGRNTKFESFERKVVEGDGRITEEELVVPRPSPTTTEELLPTTETSNDGEGDHSFGKDRDRNGNTRKRFWKRFQRR